MVRTLRGKILSHVPQAWVKEGAKRTTDMHHEVRGSPNSERVAENWSGRAGKGLGDLDPLPCAVVQVPRAKTEPHAVWGMGW